MKENVYKKVKLNEKDRTNDNTKSYLISIKKYVSITLKGMEPSEISKKRKTEARYGPQALLYDKKIAKKEGIFFYKCPSFYKGKLKNGKANGWGIEALRAIRARVPNYYPLHQIIQFYEGEWKNGKRNGYGERYNYHPIIGSAIQYELEGQVIKMDIDQDNPGIVYKGNWVDGVEEGEGIFTIGLKSKTSGVFKNGKFWEGIWTSETEKKIETNNYKKGKIISTKTVRKFKKKIK
jgi:hypothetical protein|tara:strand:+ start:996 stop:1700 length:705 start_codon:yes stop_codon:yes gene_type:complete